MKIIKIDRDALATAAKVLILGKVIVCPTDTVYGLICDAANKAAVRRLFKIKNRQRGKPIPVFVKDIKMAKRLAFIDNQQEQFLRKHWPGRVTAVFRSKSGLPKILLSEDNTIGLRIADHPFIKALLNLVKQPLTGTSANVSGWPPCRSAKAIIRQFKNRQYRPDLVIDAGRLPRRKVSKVVDLTRFPPKTIRK